MSKFDQLSDAAYVRKSQLVANRCGSGATGSPLLPFSSATLWRKVKAGTFPSPIKLGERVTAWRVGDVREWLRTTSAS